MVNEIRLGKDRLLGRKTQQTKCGLNCKQESVNEEDSMIWQDYMIWVRVPHSGFGPRLIFALLFASLH